MYWRSRNLSALYVWLFGPFTPVNSRVTRGDTVQQAIEKMQGQLDAAGVGLDDTVTEESSNAVKSSGIWTWVKGLFTTHATEANAHPASAITNDSEVEGANVSLALNWLKDNGGESLLVEHDETITDYYDTLTAAFATEKSTIIIGRDRSEIFYLSKPVYLQGDKHYIINGTVKLSDRTGQETTLVTNANINDTSVRVTDPSIFKVGEWIGVWDTNSNYSYDRYRCSAAIITDITDDVITFDGKLAYNYTTAASAKAAHANSVIIAQDVDNFTISGVGVIDGNKVNQIQLHPVISSSEGAGGVIEEQRSCCGLVIFRCNNFYVKDITIQNGLMHTLSLSGHDGSDSIKNSYCHFNNLKLLNAGEKNFLHRDTRYSTLDNILCDGAVWEDGIAFYALNEYTNLSNITLLNNLRSGIIFVSNQSNFYFTVNNIICRGNGTGLNINSSNIIINNVWSGDRILISGASYQGQRCIMNNIEIVGVTSTGALDIFGEYEDILISNIVFRSNTVPAIITRANGALTPKNIRIVSGIISNQTGSAVSIASGTTIEYMYFQGLEGTTNYTELQKTRFFTETNNDFDILVDPDLVGVLVELDKSQKAEHNIVLSNNISTLYETQIDILKAAYIRIYGATGSVTVEGTSIVGNEAMYDAPAFSTIKIKKVDTNRFRVITDAPVITDPYNKSLSLISNINTTVTSTNKVSEWRYKGILFSQAIDGRRPLNYAEPTLGVNVLKFERANIHYMTSPTASFNWGNTDKAMMMVIKVEDVAAIMHIINKRVATLNSLGRFQISHANTINAISWALWISTGPLTSATIAIPKSEYIVLSCVFDYTNGNRWVRANGVNGTAQVFDNSLNYVSSDQIALGQAGYSLSDTTTPFSGELAEICVIDDISQVVNVEAELAYKYGITLP